MKEGNKYYTHIKNNMGSQENLLDNEENNQNINKQQKSFYNVTTIKIQKKKNNRNTQFETKDNFPPLNSKSDLISSNSTKKNFKNRQTIETNDEDFVETKNKIEESPKTIDIYKIITSYNFEEKLSYENLNLFFFNPIPEDKTFNTNVNLLKNIDSQSEFDYNLEISRNNKTYFFAKLVKTVPYLKLKIFIHDEKNNIYNIVGKISSNVLRNNFLVFKGDTMENYIKVLDIHYDIHIFNEIRIMNVNKYEKEKINLTLCNNLPEWDVKNRTYKLDFNGRVKQSSRKNFILIEKDRKINDEEDNKKYLQCGIIDENKYALDFIGPLSPFESFCISLTSILKKFLCD